MDANIVEMFKKFLDDEYNMKDKVVKKSVPAKKEWVAKWKTIKALTEEVNEKGKKLNALKHNFWSEVELELNNYSQMRYNTKTNEIEIMTNQEDGAIPSPFAK